MAKKVKYGLRNVHYAVVTETVNAQTGETTSSYGTVKKWPGAVSITLDPSGEDTPFYADDSIYETLSDNKGYSGTFTSALLPDDVYTSVLGQTEDTNGLVIEKESDVKKYIALMFEFQMDSSGRRFCFYRCMLTRPSVNGQTTEGSITPQTEAVNINMSPRPDDGMVKTFADKDKTIYSTFYDAVPLPTP